MARNKRRFPPVCGGRLRQEHGAVIVFVALGLVVLIGMVGLAIDLGHAYVNKSQLQNIADAAALAGASALNGTSQGLQEAEARATDYGTHQYLDNKTEFNRDQVGIPGSAVWFSEYHDRAWLHRGDVANPANIRFVRVVVPARPTSVYFAKVVPGITGAITFGAEAVAGQEPSTQWCGGLDPFSPSALNVNDSNFGYQRWGTYALRLAPGNSSGGPGVTCEEQGLYTHGLTGNFGLADPASLGPDSPSFSRTLLGDGGSACVTTGTGTLPTNTGVSATPVLRDMNARFSQDVNQTQYTGMTGQAAYAAYEADSRSNGRRVIRTAFNDGVIPTGRAGTYNVVGAGCFFMPARLSVSPPSASVCLVFIGACDTGGNSTGGDEASITRTVLFR